MSTNLVDPRDEPFPCYRVRFSEDPPLDGRSFWLSLTRAEDGIVQYRWDLSYQTRAEALSVADALVTIGTAHSVFVHEQLGVIRRAK